MDFDNRKVYCDTSITDGLVFYMRGLDLCPQIIDWQAQIKLREMSDEKIEFVQAHLTKGLSEIVLFPHKRELPVCCILGY